MIAYDVFTRELIHCHKLSQSLLIFFGKLHFLDCLSPVAS